MMSADEKVSYPTKIYVGNLSWHTKLRDLELLFSKFGLGQVMEISLVPRIGSTFAVVEFSDEESARDAMNELDGRDFLGKPVHVELIRGQRSPSPVRRLGRRFDYAIKIYGIPKFTTWQNLKDEVRVIGEVTDCHVDVEESEDGNLVGIVEFMRLDEMKKAIKKMDGLKLNNYKGFSGQMRIVQGFQESNSHSGSRSRSRGRSVSSRQQQTSSSPKE